MKLQLKKTRHIRGETGAHVFTHIILWLFALCAIVPFLVLFSSSFTDQAEILHHGYWIFPRVFSLDAYKYLWSQKNQILNAYGITILVTIIGTVVNVIVSTLMAYPLSRKDLPAVNVFAFLVFFTMLFNGGLVPTYLVYTNYLDIKNSIWALVIPRLLLSPWYVMLCRTHFATSIPSSVIESAKIDGANEMVIYGKIILPMGKAMVATVALFAGIAYWNDWYNGMIYLTNFKLFSIQNLLYRMLQDIQYMANVAQMGGQVDELATSLPATTVRMAIATIGIIPIIIIYPFIQKNFVKGISVGAVKG